MIARVWSGTAPAAEADTYQHYFESDVTDHLKSIEGFAGAELWRREMNSEVEFVAVTRWFSLEAVRAFAGDDYEAAVVEPAARRVLSRWDERVCHYEVEVTT